MEQQRKHIIFFDGDCLICNRFVQKLLRIDRKKKFLFSSLQSEFSRATLKNIPKKIDSIVYLSPEGSFIKSEAVLKIIKQLGFPYTICYLLKILPIAWRDALYDYFAKNRYQWFGKNESCKIPSKAERERFI
ncbi:thiol-disulfide oxidoreductase DCC family protein [Sphingobacterium sp. UBA1498]|uniref:thiol-disulfide oxidoreductase DCC family protein n=1 Tax=Sphingobacterium sp. UBA1498 TaxID=1947481 RepID=UPI0025E06A0B|nr:DCC1-like thiol-disulfide oxidoreductase family protein [Sphingobacterium sp. UBA1498]